MAPHPASRRRSYGQLQAGEGLPEEDFHLSDKMRSRAHECGSLLPPSRPGAGQTVEEERDTIKEFLGQERRTDMKTKIRMAALVVGGVCTMGLIATNGAPPGVLAVCGALPGRDREIHP